MTRHLRVLRAGALCVLICARSLGTLEAMRFAHGLARSRRIATSLLVVASLVTASSVSGLSYRVCRWTNRAMLECCCPAVERAEVGSMRAPCCCDARQFASLADSESRGSGLDAVAVSGTALVAVVDPYTRRNQRDRRFARIRSRDGPRRVHVVLGRYLI